MSLAQYLEHVGESGKGASLTHHVKCVREGEGSDSYPVSGHCGRGCGTW
jgi:hypothetical protein